ncbi:hypothetical protein B5X24_HaOG209515 [Helicoverpa armigera]|uniref:RNA-directed DNA polymerase n=1 Tax=Helicoverpa armigera TaxID=29058 RepID=A0A2W1BDZ7_HELAM|nr:hypothetical protein B5X24_HaOG209515 [Helicoverpa armigera]
MNLMQDTNLSVIVNSKGVTLIHQPAVFHMRLQSEKFDNLDCDLTDGDQINELKLLLAKFEHLFIRGYPHTRVNTGELEIRLKDPNKCVERRPYRLSPIERQKVRDIVTGFHQIPISEGSIEKTAFVTPDGMYEYLAMPFGLSNACSVYQRCMNRALADLLNSPDQENAPIELYTDASSLGYGAVLVQVIGGRQHPVAYMSQRTTDAESRYHSYELETLAVVRAVKHFRHYLYGRKFKVITDCNALKASKHKKDLLPRIHRWWAFLQNYEFEVEYRKGERLQHADFFSRNPTIEMAINIMTKDTEWLQIEQRRDDTLRPVINSMTTDNPAPGYVLEEGVLKKLLADPSILGTCKPTVVPKSFQWSLINSFHTSLQHPGWEKTLQKLRDSYWFPNMSTIVRRFVDNCVICRTSKGPSGAIQAQLHPIQKPTAAFQVIHMDITGKLGTRNAEGQDEYVIVIIDAFTKYILLNYSNDKSQSSSLAALKRVVHLFGTPVQVVVDGGREFLGEFKAYCDCFGINLHAIAPGTALDALQLAFNCTPHRVTGCAPLTLLTRRKHTVPPELLRLVDIDNESIDFDMLDQHVQRKMAAAAEYDKHRFDRNKAKLRPFQRGDYVLIKNNPRNQTSLDLKYSEPYEIYRILDNDRYMVKRVTGRGRPRKVAHDQLRRAPQPGEQETVSTGANDDTEQQTTAQIVDTPDPPSTSQTTQLLDA